jgi:hypothetical protein
MGAAPEFRQTAGRASRHYTVGLAR